MTAVLLDMDDTIFDHALTCLEAIRALREEEEFLRRRGLEELWRDYLTMLEEPSPGAHPGLSSNALRERRWRRIARSCGAELAPDRIAGLSREYRAHYQRLRRPIAGAIPLVRRLHQKVRVAIVTNNEVAEQEEKLRFLGLESDVDALVVSEAVGTSKPDPRIFEAALRRLDAEARSTVMLGDSWTNDVLGARGAGLVPVWFNRFGLPRPDPSPVEELRSFEPSAAVTQALLGELAPVNAGPRARP